MWHERNRERPNYARISYVSRQHHARFTRYVEAHGMTCQECGGAGGETDVLFDGMGPWEPCGWCEGEGRVTRWLRGRWLRMMQDEKRRLNKEMDEHLCPECGGKMVSRVNAKTGQRFWGCADYPRCTGTRNADGLSRDEEDAQHEQREGHETWEEPWEPH